MLKTEDILEKLELLSQLCVDTDTSKTTKRSLFSDHLIVTQDMINEVRDIHTNKNNIGPVSESRLMVNIMRQANKIWRLRNKIKDGDIEWIEHTEMLEEIEEFITVGSKINAIKYYREWMNKQTAKGVSLREAKEFVDQIAHDMKKRGMVK
tara:strand:- start:55 stop:507 length:453 start_codon:yes stop_codon:yes gene_type:complete